MVRLKLQFFLYLLLLSIIVVNSQYYYNNNYYYRNYGQQYQQPTTYGTQAYTGYNYNNNYNNYYQQPASYNGYYRASNGYYYPNSAYSNNYNNYYQNYYNNQNRFAGLTSQGYSYYDGRTRICAPKISLCLSGVCTVRCGSVVYRSTDEDDDD